MLRSQVFVVDLQHLVFGMTLVFALVVVAATAAVATVRSATVVAKARLPERQQRQIRATFRAASGIEQNPRPCTVNALQRLASQALLGILVVQRYRELLGAVRSLSPSIQDPVQFIDLPAMLGCRDRLFRAYGLGQGQVIDKAKSMTAFDRLNLVLAISIERGELQLERAVGAAEVHQPFLSVMADDQCTALVGGWEHYHQRRDHPIQPLAVAM